MLVLKGRMREAGAGSKGHVRPLSHGEREGPAAAGGGRVRGFVAAREERQKISKEAPRDSVGA